MKFCKNQMICTKICALSRRALAVEVQGWVSRRFDSARGRTGITGKWKSKEFCKNCEVRTMATATQNNVCPFRKGDRVEITDNHGKNRPGIVREDGITADIDGTGIESAAAQFAAHGYILQWVV